MKQTTFILTLFLFFLFPFCTVAQGEKKDSLLQLISKTTDDSVRVNTLLKLSQELKNSEPKQAFLYTTEALKLAESISLKRGMAKANYQLGDYYRLKEAFIKAREYYFKAFDLDKELADTTGMSSSANYIGMMYANQGAYSDALKFYFVSLRLNEKMKDKFSIAVSYNNIGNINDLLGEYDEALSFYFKSLQLKQEMNNKSGVANTLNNIGEIYKKLGKFPEAMDYYLRSLELKKELKNKSGMANTLNNIGDVYVLKQEYKAALNYYNQSLLLLEELDDKDGKATVNDNIGALYFKMQQYVSAIEYLKTGLKLAVDVGSTEEQRKAYMSLSDVYEKLGDYKQANEYIKQNALIKDSLLNDRNNKQISEMQAKYEYEKNKKEITYLMKEQDLQKLAIYNSRMLSLSAFIGFVMLLIIVIVYINGYRQKRRANQLLIVQNTDMRKQKDEKELLLKEIHHRVKNNLQIINSLLRLQSHQIEDKRALAMFEECQNRIISMAIIHEKLYRSEDLANIDTKNYIETLAASLIRSYRTDMEVELEVNCTVSSVGIDTLMPLGLILNELISNSLKYAFTDRSGGNIQIGLNKKYNGEFEMTVQDNGIGLPADFSWEDSTTLGIELIKTLVEQVDGTIEKMAGPGTCFKICFRDITK